MKNALKHKVNMLEWKICDFLIKRRATHLLSTKYAMEEHDRYKKLIKAFDDAKETREKKEES